jgi:uncharacterized protein (DUF433 family)
MKSAETEVVAPTEPRIIERGRGPEIEGTRVTVYSILDCMLECWPPERIADWLNLSTRQVEAAVVYLREHTAEVLTNYLKILEESARGNPPEVQAELDASRAKFRELAKEIREVRARADADIKRLIRQHRAARVKEHADAGNHGGQ